MHSHPLSNPAEEGDLHLGHNGAFSFLCLGLPRLPHLPAILTISGPITVRSAVVCWVCSEKEAIQELVVITDVY